MGGKGKGKWKDKGKEKKKGPYWICSGDHFKKEYPNRNRRNKKGGNGSNIKLLGNSTDTMEEDKNYAFMVEETSDEEETMSVSDYKGILDKSWSEEKFEKEVENQLDVEELATKEIASNVMNALDPIEELYDLYSDEEETLWITEIIDEGLNMEDGLVDPYMDL